VVGCKCAFFLLLPEKIKVHFQQKNNNNKLFPFTNYEKKKGPNRAYFMYKNKVHFHET
jgi:hypothetical protein